MLSHCPDNEGTNHSREGPHTIGDPHEDAGIAWSNVQVVDVETCDKSRNLKVRVGTESLLPFGKRVNQFDPLQYMFSA